MRYTSDTITHLEADEVFVFGSNLRGAHGGGAAKLAAEKFGAIQGVGIGHQGQSYALPTLDARFNKLPLQEIEKHIRDLVVHAIQHPELTFLVTQVGCGIAGFTPKEIAPLFFGFALPPNVVLPEVFHKAAIPATDQTTNRKKHHE